MPPIHDRNKLKTEVVHKTVATRTFEWHEIKGLLLQRMVSEMQIDRTGTVIDHGKSQRMGDSKAKLRNDAEVVFKVEQVKEGSPSYGTDKYEITLTYTHDHEAVKDAAPDRDDRHLP